MRTDRRQLIRRIIDEHGQFLQQVLRSDGDPEDFEPFWYTIGNHEHGLPELLFIGSDENAFGDMLNMLGDIQRARKQSFTPHELVSLGAQYPVLIVDTDHRARTEYAVQIGEFYDNQDFAVLQVVLCDQHGRYPDDNACEEPYRSQTLLQPGLN